MYFFFCGQVAAFFSLSQWRKVAPTCYSPAPYKNGTLHPSLPGLAGLPFGYRDHTCPPSHETGSEEPLLSLQTRADVLFRTLGRPAIKNSGQSCLSTNMTL